MYKLAGVTKDYRKGRGTVHALQGVDLVIEDGDWLAIQGPTGHGKSTLLQILGGLDRPTSGTVNLDGRNLAALRERQLTKVRAASIGFIFQTFNLIPTLSAQENVETALVPLRVSADERSGRAGQALAEVGLADRARHLPSELSGGQQQRVAIARALVKRPARAARRRADRQPRRGHQGRDHDPARPAMARIRAHPGDRHSRHLGCAPGPHDRSHACGQAGDPLRGKPRPACPGRRQRPGTGRRPRSRARCPRRPSPRPPRSGPGRDWRLTLTRW